MTSKTAFIVLLRMIFVLSSLQFMRDAFYKWDGYSYYMRFMEFLPDLSLTYVFLVIFSAIFAGLLWLGIYIFKKIIPRSLNIGLAHILTWLILCVLLLVSKKVFFKSIPLTKLFGLNYFVIIIVGGILSAGIVWLLRGYNEKMLNGLNTRITPLVWIFVLCLVISVPSSLIKGGFIGKSIDTHYANKDVEKRSAKESNEKRPNIILVVMDALTACDMDVYGYHRQTTPFITEWAKNAIVYTRAYSSSNWTTPAMMSMLTGQRPWTHGVWYRAYFNPVHNYENNLPKVLKNHGYNVYGFVQNHYAHPEVLGLGDYFSIKEKSYTFSLPAESLQSKVQRYFVHRPIFAEWVLNVQPVINALINHARIPMRTTLVPPELVYDRFLNFFSQKSKESKNNTKPFFALLHVLPPHTAYLPPEPYLGLYGDPGRFGTDTEQERIIRKEYPPEMQPEIDILRKRYDEYILYSDKQFELFMSRLAQTVDMSNTVIIFTSDHGESFSHGYQEHDGPYLYEQLVHVPLIIRTPGTKSGTRINVPVEQISIAPTILELAGISVPEWMEERPLTTLVEGESLWKHSVFSMQLIRNRSFSHPITKGTVAVWGEDYKLIYDLENKKTLLFNLAIDPYETKDVSEERAETAQELLTLINGKLSSANARIAHHNNYR